MSIQLRETQHSDISFLREMLYEAVFWRNPEARPSIEEALALPDVRIALTNWGEREGDLGVVANLDRKPVGAAWIRFFTEEQNIRGYINESMPVMVIGVHEDFRRLGIGGKMSDWLIEHISQLEIEKISLCVSKDNHALDLYRKKGFQVHTDIGDSYLMTHEIESSTKG